MREIDLSPVCEVIYEKGGQQAVLDFVKRYFPDTGVGYCAGCTVNSYMDLDGYCLVCGTAGE